jgi:hypothetical protein
MRKTCGLICVAFCLFLAAPQSKAISICSATAGNLVANCGFETGDFTSWTLTGNDVPIALNNLYGVEGVDPFDGISPNSGANQAFFADLDANATTLQQAIATTASEMYTVSWFLAQDTPVGTQPTETNAFSASFGGVTLANLTAVPVQGYTEYSFVVAASSSSSVLSLTLGNDLGEFLLDDVSVVPVVSTPEPPAWTLMLVGIMGSLLFWKRDVLLEARRSIRF